MDASAAAGTTDRFETTYANRFCQDLAERYYASFAGYTMMTNGT